MTERPAENPERHGGELAVAAARAYGVRTMFTLSGAHVFPLYDAATHPARPDPTEPEPTEPESTETESTEPEPTEPEPPMRLIDVRHEQTAVFAAEATGRLGRTPGFAVLTAGPGVTNGVSALTQAQRAGSPVVVLGGRAAAERWGWGSLQELDHPALLGPITKRAWTIERVEDLPRELGAAFALAGKAHRGPVFVDVPMDRLFSRTTETDAPPADETPADPAAGFDAKPDADPDAGPDPDAVRRAGTLLAAASRPVVILGSDVWLDGAETAALEFVETTRIPVVTNGSARGVVPAGHPLLVGRARKPALKEADLVLVVGTPLDFRLGYGHFGPGGSDAAARVIHVVDAPSEFARHVTPEVSIAGPLGRTLDALARAWSTAGRRTPEPELTTWRDGLRGHDRAIREGDAALLTSAADPIHPARVYGELLPLLDDDAVVIGDGGDFVSFAGRFVEPRRPGCWLDPGPFGCLGGGVGEALAARLCRPASQVVLLLGDGAAGFSLMDVDTLVRHRIPVVMVVGNNGCWGLERQSMRMLYGYDVAAELRASTAYDGVVRALGGAGETVRRPDELGPALRRAFASGVPYLVNVLLDPDLGYPRATFGI